MLLTPALFTTDAHWFNGKNCLLSTSSSEGFPFPSSRFQLLRSRRGGIKSGSAEIGKCMTTGGTKTLEALAERIVPTSRSERGFGGNTIEVSSVTVSRRSDEARFVASGTGSGQGETATTILHIAPAAPFNPSHCKDLMLRGIRLLRNNVMSINS